MYLRYFILLSVFTLNNCYSPNRQPRLATIKNASPKPQELVIPARYKVKNTKTTLDPKLTGNVLSDDFPEVEYPSNIMESSKPFYMSLNPFSQDVKTSFKSLAPGTTKTPTIVVNLKSKEKNNTGTSQSQKVTASESVAELIENKGINATIVEGQNMDKQFTNCSSQLTESDEMEYVVELIDDLDEFLASIAEVETEFIDMANSTHAMFDSECPDECSTITSDVTMKNNASDTELNQTSLHKEPPSPVFVRPQDSSTNVTTKSNEGMTDTTFCSDTPDDLTSIDKIGKVSGSS
ncbi:uncharacterized protein LOC142982238 isoform X1 [Anticarsia gemmatalis]|uniref:uncharacterized protein LOC142982238 isoform X1 n=1 Tax=Anticarsia gemmatalis TaxID=129554 RepID=UPI003F770915